MTPKLALLNGRNTRERGVSLLFALLALVSLSLAAVAVVRSVDTSAQVMGNLGFKQDATSSADKAAQHAITVVLSDAALDRTKDSEAVGYYAMAHESIDVTGQQISNATRELINWDVNECAYAANAAQATCKVRPAPELEYNGNKLRYVIFRLCSALGDPSGAGNTCARPKLKTASSGTEGTGSTSTAAPKRGEFKYGEEVRFIADPSAPPGTYQGVYYRIVVRVIGARNTTSFVETIVHL